MHAPCMNMHVVCSDYIQTAYAYQRLMALFSSLYLTIHNKSFPSRGMCLTVPLMAGHGISTEVIVFAFAYFHQLNVQKVSLYQERVTLPKDIKYS